MDADPDAYETIVKQLDTPSYVVTVAAGAERAGCLVGFASQCSIDPPRFAVWLSKENRTFRVAGSATTLVVHVLREGDQDLADRFGAETGDEIDKFEGLGWRPGPDGCPVLARCDWFAGSIIERLDTGDHVAFLLAPSGGRCERSDLPQLGLQDLGDIRAGHPISKR